MTEQIGPSPEAIETAHLVLDLARDGDAARLAAYLDAGVPVDLTDAQGNTLVMLAAYNGNAAAVDVLVGRGADVDRLNDRGQSPVAGAVFKGDQGIVEQLVAAGADVHAGSPSAVDSARFFGREDLLPLLGQ